MNAYEKRIIFIGDSLTVGSEVAVNKRWTTIASNKLKSDHINMGINGDTTLGMVSRFDKEVEAVNLSHLFIMGGTNDIWWQIEPKVAISNIMTLVAHALHREIAPIVGIPFNINPKRVSKEWSRELDLDHIYKQMEQYQDDLKQGLKLLGIPYVDFSSNPEVIDCLDDGLHPNEKGHHLMAQLITPDLL
ncbi:lysophospholipase L1-like esterase [Desulfitispora alkaliphila]|uniref:GDSL-type esterase/lipase family protein n=1 Tax=Desulfitispora alkaliphila TaxID=622674 RepID=UPI003D1BA361